MRLIKHRRKKMDIRVVASTHVGYKADREELNKFAGKAAGVCYMPENFAKLNSEDEAKTLRRSEMTKASGHHSVFGHSKISLELENIPKLFAMLLNNEKIFDTSEKSARYTKMELNGIEKELYDKWLNMMVEIITEKYGEYKYFDEKRIKKLAMENARYFTSVMTPTSMLYTVSYRQLNYICGWMKQFSSSDNQIYRMLAHDANSFVEKIEQLGLLDEKLMNDGKDREFSLIGKRIRKEQFGECYSINYKGSFAMYAQTQRHRTLHYEMMLDENPEFFIPPILQDNPALVEEWLMDMRRVQHLIPQGELVNINERGDYENLILKAKERLCTAAQLEVAQNTKQTIERYIQNTDNDYVKKDLEKINVGSRCMSGFKCEIPCAFKEGIDLNRNI